MSYVAEFILNWHNWWNDTAKIKAKVSKFSSPIRFGVLGAAEINYTALFDPVESHPDAIVTAVAARSFSRAQKQIKKYKIDAKAYGSYDDLVADPDIDAIYVPTPNGLHAEWAIKSLRAGKHVLIEKPIASNASEARQIQAAAKETGKVALEAYHWRFHPAAHTTKSLIESGQYGRVTGVTSTMTMPEGVLSADDIRFNFDLAGGAAMDVCYVFCSICYLVGKAAGGPAGLDFRVDSANARLNKTEPRIEDAISTEFTITTAAAAADGDNAELTDSNGGRREIKAATHGDLAVPKLFGLITKWWSVRTDITIHLDNADIIFDGFAVAWVKHSITIKHKDSQGHLTGKSETIKAYSGGPLWSSQEGKTEEWWTTYRYQVEAFAAKVRAVEAGNGEAYTGPWMTMDESVQIMDLIDKAVEKAGLPRKGK